jgi:hypothetical protein
MRRATLLLPEPAGPSMAIVSLRIGIASKNLPPTLLQQARFSSFRATCRAAIFWHPRAETIEFPLATVNFLSESHDVVAAIDVDRFAGNAGSSIGEQERSGSANLSGIDIALQRGALCLHFEHVPETADASCR